MKNRILLAFIATLLLGLLLMPNAFAECTAPNNGGTANLPPPCAYGLTNPWSMAIIAGLPAGTTIRINSQIGGYSGASEAAGGSLGGNIQTYNAVMPFSMAGTGDLAGYNRLLSMGVAVETHSAPRTPGNPIQSFDTDMFRLQGQLPIGDPDFDLLRIVAGTGFGMPSPGHTTLTHLADGSWAVDSFFDIEYRIDFIGKPGGILGGRSGSTIGTTRFEVVPEPSSLSAMALLILGAVPVYLRRRAWM